MKTLEITDATESLADCSRGNDSDAMAMVGHRTESIYRRYAISDEASLKQSGAKLSNLHKIEKDVSQKVIPIKKKSGGK